MQNIHINHLKPPFHWTIRNVGQNDADRSRNGKSVVEAAILAVCKQFRLDTTELLIYTRSEQTLGAKRLDRETTSWETQKPGFFMTCL